MKVIYKILAQYVKAIEEKCWKLCISSILSSKRGITPTKIDDTRTWSDINSTRILRVLLKQYRSPTDPNKFKSATIIKVCRQRRKTFLFLFYFLLRFLTLVGNLSVFVLSFLIFLLLSFSLSLSVVITSSIFNRFSSNFQDMMRPTRLSCLLSVNEIGLGVGTGRGHEIWFTLYKKNSVEIRISLCWKMFN